MKYHFLLISKNNRGRNLSQTYYAKGHFSKSWPFAWVLESFTVNFLYSCGQNFLGTWEAKPSNACYRFIFKIIAHFEKDLLSGLRKRFQMRCWSQSSPETTSERGVAHSQLISAPSRPSVVWHFLVCRIWADRTSPPAWGGGWAS